MKTTKKIQTIQIIPTNWKEQLGAIAPLLGPLGNDETRAAAFAELHRMAVVADLLPEALELLQEALPLIPHDSLNTELQTRAIALLKRTKAKR